MSAGWSVLLMYAGQTERVDDLDLAWSQTLGAAGPTAVTLTLATTMDLRTLARRYKPSTGYAVLSRNGIPEMADSWRNVRWKPCDGGAVLEITLAPTEQEDRGVFPPVTTFEMDVGAKVFRGLSTVTASEYFNRYGTSPPSVDKSGKNTRYLVDVYKIAVNVFPNLAEQAKNKPWPWPYGTPGDATTPGSPAYIVDVTGTYKFMIAGRRVAASTVTIFGPDNNLRTLAYIESYTATITAGGTADQAEAAGNAAGLAAYDGAPLANDVVPVRHTTTADGTTYAYVDGADLSNVTIDPSREYFVAWTGGEAGPGGAGDLLLEVLSTATVAIDFAELRRVAPILNTYRLAGYAERSPDLRPTTFAQRVLLPLLPVDLVPGPIGLRPILKSWATGRTAREDGPHLIDGASVVSDPNVEYADAGDTVGSIVVEYAYDPQAGATGRQAVADAATTALALVAEEGGTDTISTYSIWDPGTAARVADDALRARAWAPTSIRLHVSDLSDHDTGGRRALALGQRVRFTSARLGYDADDGVVSEVERSGTALSVVLYMDDDPLTPR